MKRSWIFEDYTIKAEIENPIPHTENSKRYKYINPHLFRHSFIHFLFSKKINPRIIQKLARHNRLETTSNYGKESIEEIQETYDNVIGEL